LKGGANNKQGLLKKSSDCHAKLDIKGNKQMGDIHVGHAHKDCDENQVPTKMNYKLTQKGLKVCSDFKSGKHQCEFLKKD
jgi:hypothetical protein